MCGIFGTTLRYSRKVIEHKLELMNFRGPDHTGIKEFDVSSDMKLTLGQSVCTAKRWHDIQVCRCVYPKG